jgi:cytochrome c oxidase assembly protein subunit 11
VSRHRSLTARLWLFSGGFFLFGFALVPLYSVLCNVTGYGDQSQLVQAATVKEAPVAGRLVTVEFLSSAPTVGDWEFRPEQASMEVQPGRLYEAKFYAKNLHTQPVTAQAVPSIAPTQATQYFHKTECFCFTPQQFGALEGRDLKVRFILAPELPANIDRVTLGYGMFTAPKQVAQAGSP